MKYSNILTPKQLHYCATYYITGNEIKYFTDASHTTTRSFGTYLTKLECVLKYIKNATDYNVYSNILKYATNDYHMEYGESSKVDSLKYALLLKSIFDDMISFYIELYRSFEEEVNIYIAQGVDSVETYEAIELDAEELLEGDPHTFLTVYYRLSNEAEHKLINILWNIRQKMFNKIKKS